MNILLETGQIKLLILSSTHPDHKSLRTDNVDKNSW